MGYIDTILGYGQNHMEVPLRMFFTKIVRDGDLGIVLNLDNIVETLNQKVPLTAYLQDDLYLKDHPDQRTIDLNDEHDLWEALDDSYISKTHGCRFGRACCFIGIIVEDCGVCYMPNKTQPLPLEEKLANAKKWVSELIEQKRLPSDIKLVMEQNCCS